MRYNIIKARSLEELLKLVNDAVMVGFSPTGGILVEKERERSNKTKETPAGEWGDVFWYTQAMFRGVAEAQADQVLRFNVWDRYAAVCGDRDNEVGTNCTLLPQQSIGSTAQEGTFAACNPNLCPKKDKPNLMIKANPIK